MSSARFAPVGAARTAPVWRRSCQRRSLRPALRGPCTRACTASTAASARRLGREDQRITSRYDVFRQVVFDRRDHVRRDRDVADTGVGLRRGDVNCRPRPHRGAANADHFVPQVDVPASKLDGLTEAHRAPGREQHHQSQPLGHRGRHDASSSTDAGPTLWTRLALPAPGIRHGFESISSSLTAVARIVRSRL